MLAGISVRNRPTSINDPQSIIRVAAITAAPNWTIAAISPNTIHPTKAIDDRGAEWHEHRPADNDEDDPQPLEVDVVVEILRGYVRGVRAGERQDVGEQESGADERQEGESDDDTEYPYSRDRKSVV